MSPKQAKLAETFIGSNQSWLQRFLVNKLDCHYDAQDVAQDTFMRIISTSVDTLELKEPRAYLATIANRLIIDRARRNKIERAYLEKNTPAEDDFQTAHSSETTLENIEKVESIVRMLEGLPRKPQRAFLMSRLEGKKYQEIADELGVSTTMVKKYIAKVLLNCYKLIEHEE